MKTFTQLMVIFAALGTATAYGEESKAEHVHAKVDRGARKAVHAVGHAAKKTGEALEKAAHKTGEAVDRTAKKTGLTAHGNQNAASAPVPQSGPHAAAGK